MHASIPNPVRSAALLMAVLLCLFSMVAVQPVLGQSRSVVGVVTDSTTLQPVVAAHILLVGEDRHFTTDDAGRFLILDVHDAEAVLEVDALGYGTVSRTVPVGAGELVRILLGPQAGELEGISVTGAISRRAEELRRPQSSTRMDEEQISRERGQTLGETIKGIEGVTLIQYGPSLAKPVVRGLHSQRIIVMNAGVRQEGQQWGTEHAPEIDVFGVNEVEVLRGPGAVIYGSDALGGVVRVEPGAPPTEPGWGAELVANGFANNAQGAGSIMLQRGDTPLPWLGETGLRLRMSGRKAGDARTPEFNMNNTGFTELNVGVDAGVTRPWGAASLRYSRFSTELGLYSGAHVGNFEDLLRAMEEGPVPSDFSYEIDNPRQTVDHQTVRAEAHAHLEGTGTLQGVYAFQLNQRREFDNHGPLAGRDIPAFGLDLYTHSLDLRLDHEEVLGLRGSIGANAMRQGNVSRGKGFLIPQYRLYTGALFASEEWTRGPLTVQSGLRYDYRWQRVFPYSDAGIVSADESRAYQGVAGSFGASLSLADTWSLGSTVGRAWRPPNVNERFSQGVHHGTAQYELGDTALATERTLSADLTLRRDGERLSLLVSTYRNRITDYIYLEPREPVLTIRGAFPAFTFQQTDALLTGLEVSTEALVTPRVSLRASGSVTRGTDRLTDEPLYDMPADRLNLGTRVALFDGPRVRGAYVDVGVTIVRDQDQVPSSTIYALPTAGYSLMNLELGASEVRIGSWPVELSLSVQNLLDRTYRDYLSRYKLFIDNTGRDIILRARIPLGTVH